MNNTHGILCLDKSQQMTSFDCCAMIRRLLGIKKVGHGGTLDPMATGVLPILVGKATRALDLLPVQDKRYTATLRFGLTSDTLDIWGNVQPTNQPLPTLSEVEAALPAFRGHIMQVPPMMSAIKQDGVRLYQLARQGVEVERQPRPVTIYSLEIVDCRPETGEYVLDCACSKGTYIRSLCDDLGQMLGCGAVMAGLRRTMAAGYTLDQCITVEQAQRLAEQGALADALLPVDAAFSVYPAITVTEPQAVRFSNGGSLSLQRLNQPIAKGEPVRVYHPKGHFIGLGQPKGDQLAILKLF